MDIKTIKKFLDKNNTIGFVGATVQKDKWGYKKYKEIKKAGFKVYPINPRYKNIDGDKCFPSLNSLINFLNKKPELVITIVPPKITENIVEQCKTLGIDKVWMQPGSESEKSVKFCKDNDIEVVHNVCVVVDALQKL